MGAEGLSNSICYEQHVLFLLNFLNGAYLDMIASTGLGKLDKSLGTGFLGTAWGSERVFQRCSKGFVEYCWLAVLAVVVHGL